MDALTVSELARRSGVPPTTVRFYDDQGLLTARRSPLAVVHELFGEPAA